MKFYLNPSNQPGNKYRTGDTNEKENMTKIAKLVGEALQRSGQEVKIGTGMESGVAESNAWPADAHVPLHSNASKGGTARGARVFFGQAKEKAQIVWAHLDAVIGGAHVPPSQQNLYEINSTKCDCIYIEAAFHDNKEDCALLLNNRKEIAEAICQGLCGAYGQKYISPSETAPAADAPEDKGPSGWARDAADWAQIAGLLQGDKDGSMRWKEPITREELAVVLHRFYNKIKS